MVSTFRNNLIDSLLCRRAVRHTGKRPLLNPMPGTDASQFRLKENLRAFVFISHHRPHLFALLQKQSGDCAPNRADAARGTGDQNRICHLFLPERSTKSKASPANPHGLFGGTLTHPELRLTLTAVRAVSALYEPRHGTQSPGEKTPSLTFVFQRARMR
jgi:hypothetical protein